MNMRTYIFLSFLFCISCAENTSFVSTAISQHVIDIDILEAEKEIKISSIFKNIRTIILKENDDVVIGGIDGIQVVDNYIFVLDRFKAKKLFVFDKEGNFIRQIGQIGVGPGEYLSIVDFCIDKEKREVYILDRDGIKIRKYNLDTGKHIESIDSRSGTDASGTYIAYNNGTIYTNLLFYDKAYTENDNMLMRIDLSTNKRTTYLSAKEYNMGWNGGVFSDFNFFSSKLNDQPKYAELMMNKVMAIDKDSIYTYLTLKKKNWVNKGDILSLDAPENGPLSDRLDEARIAYKIHNYIEWKNYILFGFFQFPENNVVLYDTETKETKYAKALVNDLVYSKGNLQPKFQFANSNAAYEIFDIALLSRFKVFETNELELSTNLDKETELMKLVKEQGEGYAIFEYEFK
jgi:hypothetical protein